jgi:hypothetical protein
LCGSQAIQKLPLPKQAKLEQLICAGAARHVLHVWFSLVRAGAAHGARSR